MSRKATPTVEPFGDCYRARLRYGKSQRQRFIIRLTDEAEAERRATALQALANTMARAGKHAEAPIILKKGGEVAEKDFPEVVRFVEGMCQRKVQPGKLSARTSFKDFATEWTSGALNKRYTDDYVKLKRSAHSDKYRLKRLFETIGEVEISQFHLEDAERAMQSLPAELSSASRRQYAQLISKVLKLAVYPCKLLARSPLPIGFLPTVTSQKMTAWLYPSEDSKLMACGAVPLLHRVLYGVLAREGMRLGEALRLRWQDIDLTLGVINLDVNKTDDPRSWVMTPGVVPALKAIRPKEAEADWLVFGEVVENRAAATFRDHLKAAGVDRMELFAETATRRPIRLHDLRATFVTLALANQKSEAWVSDRTGHKSSTMIHRYKRAARQAQELGFPMLDRLDVALGLAHPLGLNMGQLQNVESNESSMISAVPRDGIEPPTRGFSVHCSTN